MAPAPVMQSVVAELAAGRIRYCHWKSNFHLEFALAGEEDFDVLVDRQQFSGFVRILLQHGFKPADSITSRQQPGVFHFLGHDATTGLLLNVHAYTQILTGDRFLKSFALPFEDMLLSNTRTELGVPVPLRQCELIVFVLRCMLKRSSIPDLLLSRGGEDALQEELRWLTEGEDPHESLPFLRRHFPQIPDDAFLRAVSLLARPGSGLARTRLAFAFRGYLRIYQRYGVLTRAGLNVRCIGGMAVNRLVHKHKHMTLQSGGAVIAFVGPQATGKSTMARAVRKWLGREIAVRSFHVGKPPSTWLTFLPNRLIPLARRLFRNQRTRTIDVQFDQKQDFRAPYLFLVRKILLAHDRRKLLKKVFRISRQGKICLCDRYPSDNPGAVDGASFRPEAIRAQSSAVKRWLMRWETAIYRRMPQADLVVELEVPVEAAVRRNLERHKDIPQDSAYVQERHGRAHQPAFASRRAVTVSTDRGLEDTLADIQSAIWKRL